MKTRIWIKQDLLARLYSRYKEKNLKQNLYYVVFSRLFTRNRRPGYFKC